MGFHLVFDGVFIRVPFLSTQFSGSVLLADQARRSEDDGIVVFVLDILNGVLFAVCFNENFLVNVISKYISLHSLAEACVSVATGLTVIRFVIKVIRQHHDLDLSDSPPKPWNIDISRIHRVGAVTNAAVERYSNAGMS